MSERKPIGQKWESFIDEQIRRAEEAGAFRDLPGSGKPLPNLDRPYDMDWWVREKLEREGLSVTPEPLDLRRKIEKIREDLPLQKGERAVRVAVREANGLIARLNAMPAIPGIEPPALLDEDEEIRKQVR